MKERPILFSAPMVRALLDGTKTQTRRIIKPEPHAGMRWDSIVVHGYAGWTDGHGSPRPCPYGGEGDRLWVRETFYCNHAFYPDGTPPQCYWDGPKVRQEHTPEQFAQERLAMLQEMYYRADYGGGKPDFEGEEADMRWTPSIFMPRWASRITLEITNIHVQRLQDITEADAQAEGAEPGTEMWPEDPAQYGTYRLGFRHLWESINGKGSWDENPWVWAVSFKAVTP